MCAKGDHLHSMYFLVKGKVKIYTTTEEGKSLILRFKTPFAVIGDLEYIRGGDVFNEVECVMDSLLLAVPFQILRRHEQERIEFYHFLLDIMTEKFYTESHASSLNMMYPVDVRLASYLLSLSEDGFGTMYYEEMRTANLKELADLIGTSYRHLNRVIERFVSDGLLRRERGTLTVLDRAKLRVVAKGNIYE
ncbi:Crp/Fnr family transcriptional regulator [Pontibacillus halophilus JSM 076056 = DSM 19796]|uniref:Crp/Fnr family transcriptional regulator n=1 Tax=Pontibacillus halophilus JSM 076056 = DSM 19796 TaxID=1385510 RepID=A0A0A5GMC8_9BACI|nr:Crp/Fnr family transcriptional regulator [Pontibacillus halophilus JSM 076056 = DSM 19796]